MLPRQYRSPIGGKALPREGVSHSLTLQESYVVTPRNSPLYRTKRHTNAVGTTLIINLDYLELRRSLYGMTTYLQSDITPIAP